MIITMALMWLKDLGRRLGVEYTEVPSEMKQVLGSRQSIIRWPGRTASSKMSGLSGTEVYLYTYYLS